MTLLLASCIYVKGRNGGGTWVPNKVVNDSAASKNSVVDTALSFSWSTGTLTNERLSVSRKVPPGGITTAAMIAVFSELVRGERVGGIGGVLFGDGEALKLEVRLSTYWCGAARRVFGDCHVKEGFRGFVEL